VSGVLFAIVCSAINIHFATIAKGDGHRLVQKGLVVLAAVMTARAIVRALAS
jgi:hypothetical protein